MLVLSSRLHDKIALPDFNTTIEVVAIQAGTVRLGIEAPADVRVLRQGIPDRIAEWGPAPTTTPAAEVEVPALQQVRRLIDRRLEVTRVGVAEMRRLLADGHTEDAEAVLDKIDEDLRMLGRRLRREVDWATDGMTCDMAGCGL
jgi:carbon storage regulator CsrA